MLAELNVDLRTGLTAERVLEAQRLYGKNELAPEPGAGHQGRARAGTRMLRPNLQSVLRPPTASAAWACACPAGTPFWKLVLKQFDDLLVKARQPASYSSGGSGGGEGGDVQHKNSMQQASEQQT